ncbi:MAG: hypothetical protein CMJ59_13020 [Planctomycetaceae bacterium]|nr:hypothetical protein [Planctomycetaceae bacterium]
METSLHRQLKQRYSSTGARQEVPLGDYRIDVVTDRELIEIQHGSLAAIRDKTKQLLQEHTVRVVKPIIASKHLVKLDAANGRQISRRKSPKRGQLLDIFDELVYFTQVFPHPRLTVDVLLVEVEERRYPGHGRRRRWSTKDYEVEDRLLLRVADDLPLSTAEDLWQLLPSRLPAPFHTGHLAKRLKVQRWVAQRIAYCLRQAGAVREVGKTGNTRLYDRVAHAA